MVVQFPSPVGEGGSSEKQGGPTLARALRRLLSDSPASLDMISGPLMRKKKAPVSLATARAMSVLPEPGGPVCRQEDETRVRFRCALRQRRAHIRDGAGQGWREEPPQTLHRREEYEQAGATRKLRAPGPHRREGCPSAA